MRIPRWTLIMLVSLTSWGWLLSGQTSIDLTRQGKLGSGTTLPAQCAVGQIFFKTDASAGANLYTCFAQNSWTAVGLSQGTAAGRPANCVFGQLWLSTDTGAMTYCSVTGSPGTWSPAGSSQIDTYGTPLTARPTLNFGAGAVCVDNAGANRTDCTFSGGGSGSVVLTSGSGAPASGCAAPSSSNLALYLDTANGDEWWCYATDSWKKMLSVTGSGPYVLIGGTGPAPSRPSAGNVTCYLDSTSNTQVCLDSGTGTSTMVKTWSGTATLGTTTIAANSCAVPVTVTATGVVTSDRITWTPNTDISGVTGYGYNGSDGLKIYPYPGSGTVNFRVCNGSAASLTPGAAVILNWGVVR